MRVAGCLRAVEHRGEPFPQCGAEILALKCETEHRLQIAQAIAGVVPATAEDHTVHRAVVCEFSECVGELDFPPTTWFGSRQDAEDRRVKDIATDDGKV